MKRPLSKQKYDRGICQVGITLTAELSEILIIIAEKSRVRDSYRSKGVIIEDALWEMPEIQETASELGITRKKRRPAGRPKMSWEEKEPELYADMQKQMTEHFDGETKLDSNEPAPVRVSKRRAVSEWTDEQLQKGLEEFDYSATDQKHSPTSEDGKWRHVIDLEIKKRKSEE